MSEIQEQIKLAHKRAEENDKKINDALVNDYKILIQNWKNKYYEIKEEREYEQYCNEQLRKNITNLEYKIERLKEDNKHLKELCDKYEEEHNTIFEEWKKDIKANKKAIEYIELGLANEEEAEELLDILKGDNK